MKDQEFVWIVHDFLCYCGGLFWQSNLGKLNTLARSGKTYEREHVPRICYVKLYACRGVSETISS
jgi:hypothetical protein